jgi:hypothetical protein
MKNEENNIINEMHDMKEIDAFILKFIDLKKNKMDNYNLLNDIKVPCKIVKFPYDIVKSEEPISHKTVFLNYVKGKNYYVDSLNNNFKGGNVNNEDDNDGNDVLVFLY